MINCIVIDDEPMALELLENYISKVPFLSFSAAYRDAVKALNDISTANIDLIFLDINMPDLSGLQFLETLTDPPMVVFTTAYSEYAVKSYDYEAVDYLLKPIEFERFLKAANKAYDKFLTTESRNSGIDTVFIKCGTDYHRINPEDICYIESAGNYVEFKTESKSLMSLLTMNEAMNLVGKRRFIQVHRSFSVAIRHIEVIESDTIKVCGRDIPIGQKYRENLKNLI